MSAKEKKKKHRVELHQQETRKEEERLMPNLSYPLRFFIAQGIIKDYIKTHHLIKFYWD